MLKRIIATATFGCLLLGTEAHAVPAFARQTGMDCSGCHVGAYGPQLTPAGQKFKLGGYTDSNNGENLNVPLSAMLASSYESSKKKLSADPTDHTDTNDNTLPAQEFSLFVAGRATDNLGGFIQTTYSGADAAWSIDNADIRAVTSSMKLGGKDLVLGLSLNNNPGTQDVFNTLPAWRFPFMSTELVPGPAAPLLDDGLAQHVTGLSGYAFWNNSVYGEIGRYTSLSPHSISTLGLEDEVGKVKDSTYWRLAWQNDLKKQNYHVGLVGLDADVYPDRHADLADQYQDIGLDAGYQWLGTRRHIFTADASLIHEKQQHDYSFSQGDAARPDDKLDQASLTGSYFYDQTYGGSVRLFRTSGTRDVGLYAPNPDDGSRTGSPDSSGYTLELNWTPWGKESSWMSPWANVRVGLQYTGYSQFNGSSHNYDGNGRDARDNNTTYLYIWTSI